MDDEWMMFYYARPQPARFVDEVRTLAASGHLEQTDRRMVCAAFLSRVMAANPHSIASWLAQLADLRDGARETIGLALWLSDTPEGRACLGTSSEFAGPPPDLLAQPVDQPWMLDACWAYYFATGDARAVRRVVSALEHMSDTGAAARFATSAQTEADEAAALRDALYRAASWSLISLMKQHAPLLAVCEELFDRAELTQLERIGLAFVLEKAAPARWRVVLDESTTSVTVERLA